MIKGLEYAPVQVPRRRSDTGALQATVSLALLMHVLGLLIVTVYVPNRDSDSGFFAGPPEVHLREVQMVQIKAPPKPPKPPPPPPQRAATPPPVPVSRPAAAPRGPAPVRAPSGGARAPVLASNRGRGFAVAPSNGVDGTGQGSGPGSGSGPGGPGGGNGAGGPGGPPPPPPPPATNPTGASEATQAVPLYDPFQECGIPMPGTNFLADPTARNIRTWQELCQRLGTVSWGELSSRPYVKPFLLFHPELGLGEQDALRGRRAMVQVRVTIYANHSTAAQLLSPTGTAEFDRVGYAVAAGCMFLPALRVGREVDDTVDFTINFTTYNPNGGGPAGPQPGGPPQGP